MHPIVVPPTQRQINGFATASLVLGIVGVVLGWCLILVPNVLAIIFGHVALAEIRKTGQEGRGYALSGLVMGYSIPILGLIGIAITLIFSR